ncbi:macrophage mannose receptor 1-like [Brachyhypopomus gauderio]|uniref:macrophage mannose receptor 1-like n=1 Tax=Brachyhypopomus gauderio TaxID=698409 RepID=UPI00404252BC
MKRSSYHLFVLLFLCMALQYTIQFGSRDFVIYNKDQDKCVLVSEGNAVQAGDCDPTANTQHFRWISSSHVISVSHQLCVGAQGLEEWVRVVLEPCNDHSPTQMWECKNETLFGLKGHNLHFNYGKRNQPNVLLHTGTGLWSRWQIYRTKENLCSHRHEGSRDFVIYNKDQDKCVLVSEGNAVQAGDCDPTANTQHFRWISSSHVISVSHQLCVGAQGLEEWVRVVLEPCNDHSPTQMWECKDETLFGLKGHPLHFNYGKRNQPNVLLHTGTGLWSRWQIYRTKENLCSHRHEETRTEGTTEASATPEVTDKEEKQSGIWRYCVL